ncbi:hypothetical protein D9M68_743690 [compost metagenome]
MLGDRVVIEEIAGDLAGNALQDIRRLGDRQLVPAPQVAVDGGIGIAQGALDVSQRRTSSGLLLRGVAGQIVALDDPLQQLAVHQGRQAVVDALGDLLGVVAREQLGGAGVHQAFSCSFSMASRQS